MVKLKKKTTQRRSATAKKYTAEERAQAVKLAREIGNRAADRLEINVDTLYNWLSKDKKHEELTRPKPSQAELERENDSAKPSQRKKPKWKYYRMYSVFP